MAAVQAAGPEGTLQPDVVERIRVRITAPPETLRYGSLFDENALAKALREADAALPLPEWLRQRLTDSDNGRPKDTAADGVG